ncbi:MAG: hypothetical protein KAT15_05340 [Bacteroidales bacterium]|nr:hypothetical protein [Bacteroidales bacterium]
MKVFVLGTGRSGTKTFARACEHLTNYTVSHNSLREGAGFDHKWSVLKSKDQHIEVDDRLSWLLPVMERLHGDDAYYVHLWRDPAKVVRSYARPGRLHLQGSLLSTFYHGILGTPAEKRKVRAADAEKAGAICVEVINKNIENFLEDKSNRIFIDIDDPKEPYRHFLQEIGAEGDLEAALTEFEAIYDPVSGSRLRNHCKNFIYEGKLLVLRVAGRMTKTP